MENKMKKELHHAYSNTVFNSLSLFVTTKNLVNLGWVKIDRKV